MFKCEGCEQQYNKKRKPTKGNTFHGVKLFRVTTVQRKVRYINQVRFDKVIPQGESSKVVTSYKNVGETMGLETVEEKFYCKEHIPIDIKPKVLDKMVERTTTVKVKRPDRGEN